MRMSKLFEQINEQIVWFEQINEQNEQIVCGRTNVATKLKMFLPTTIQLEVVKLPCYARIVGAARNVLPNGVKLVGDFEVPLLILRSSSSKCTRAHFSNRFVFFSLPIPLSANRRPPFPSNKMSRLPKENAQLPFIIHWPQKKILWHNYETLPDRKRKLPWKFWHNVETKYFTCQKHNLYLSFLIRYGQPP